MRPSSGAMQSCCTPQCKLSRQPTAATATAPLSIQHYDRSSSCHVQCASSIQFLSLIYLWLITPSCLATGAGSAHAPVSLPSSGSVIGVLLQLCQFITVPAPISHPCTGNMVDMITQLPSLYYTPNFTLIFCPPPPRLGRPHPHPAKYN